LAQTDGLFESTKQKIYIKREEDRARLFADRSDLATAMQVARAGTYETIDIIEKYRSRATTPFRMRFDREERSEDGYHDGTTNGLG
jgi:hypothetical protein